MLMLAAPTAIDRAVAALDGWLETLRGLGGYGGPVAHWWQQSLLYTGAGLDWRYEGIVAGYLRLWERSADQRWLDKATRAGDDLVAGQLASGNYVASTFEINPATAGTPHEAACDLALLLLATALRKAGRAGWQRYADAAARNLQQFYLAQLWDDAAQSFRDSPTIPSFVPNKAATACDALFLQAELRDEEAWVTRYALPTLDRIVAHQARGGALDGAIAQNSLGGRLVAKYFPIYVARCVPALVRGYRWTARECYLDSALRAMRWIARLVGDDGALPTVVYANGRSNRYPSWIAALGDVLRAADELRPYDFDADLGALRERLLAGQDCSGGIQTAHGFAAQASGRRARLPDLRDLLHVAGWCDKAFRYLAAHAGPELPAAAPAPFAARCIFRGAELALTETATALTVRAGERVCYRWDKGQPWAAVADARFWLR